MTASTRKKLHISAEVDNGLLKTTGTCSPSPAPLGGVAIRAQAAAKAGTDPAGRVADTSGGARVSPRCKREPARGRSHTSPPSPANSPLPFPPACPADL